MFQNRINQKLLSFLLFFCFISPLSAQEILLKAKEQKKFADYLYSQKEYYRAITEYQRFLYFFPQKEQQKIHSQIGKSYLAGKDFDGAIDYFRLLELKQPALQWNDEMKFLYALAFLDKDSHRLFHYRKKNIKSAIHILENTSKEYYLSSNNFIEDWKSGFNQLNFRSPWIAGGLSAILPGAGSFYNQRYKEAFYSFFMPFLFFAASNEARKNEKYNLEALFSFFALGFYGGNIYIAINGAHKHNNYIQSHYLNNLRIKYGFYFQF